jgi:hypothetical protein
MRTFLCCGLLAVVSAGVGTTNSSLPKLFESEGCSTLENDPDAGEKITKITYDWASRGSIIHTGLTVETSKGSYSLAYNSQTFPGVVNTPGAVWCQKGGMPMKDSRANGDCAGCGGWHSTSEKSGSWKSLKDFMGDVKKLGDSRPYYNLLACNGAGSNTANCQLFAAKLYKALVGSEPDTKGCPACPDACKH